MQNSTDQISITKEDLISSSFFNEPGEMLGQLKLNSNHDIFKVKPNGKVLFLKNIWDVLEYNIELSTINIAMFIPDDAMLTFGISGGYSGLEDISPKP